MSKTLSSPFGLLTDDEWEMQGEKELDMPRKKAASATRALAGEVDPATIREETYQGRTHIVIPVIALVEGVLRPVNSEGPELVLSSEFSLVPEGWNGRPVMMNHPAEGDTRVSANSPKVLEAFGLGTIFNAHIKDGKLAMEAWIDKSRVALVDGAADIAARLQKTPPELIDVSVGVFVSAELKTGTYNGSEYTAVWRDIVPDHLAVLPAGTPGACSVEMGCGLPRAAAKKETKMTLRERFAALLAAFKPAQSADVSDADIRNALDAALFGSVPGFIGIDAVFADRVIYVVAPPDGSSMMAPFGALPKFQRGYTLDASGAVLLGLDTVEVHETTSYEPVGNPPPAPVAAAGCGCNGGKSAARGESMKPKVAAGGRSARIQAVVDRVTAVAPELMGTDAVTALTEWSDEEIAALENLAAMLEKAPPADGTVPTTEEPVVDGGTPPPTGMAAAAVAGGEMTKEEFLACAPEPFRSILIEHEVTAAAKHTALVEQLKTAQSAYNEVELKAMATPQLEKVAKLVAASKPRTDFSALAPVGAPEGTEEKIPAPIDMNSRIRVARGIEKAS